MRSAGDRGAVEKEHDREQPLSGEIGKDLREEVTTSRGPGPSGPRSWEEGREQRRVGKGFESG